VKERIDLDCYDLAALQARQGEKWARDAPDKIPCWVADMDFPIAPPIRRALEEAIETSDLGYPMQALEERLVATFARWSKVRHGLEVDPASVVVTTDVVQGLYLAITTLSEPGDGVLVLTPAYPPYFLAFEETARNIVPVDLTVVDGAYRFDPAELRAVVQRERPRLMLLCNPHNPTGRVFTFDELHELATIADEFDLVILSDEIHCDLVYPGATHIPIATLGGETADRTITFSSASKTFNLAGLRCGVAACGSVQLASRLRSVPRRLRGTVNNLGMLATITAFEEGSPWLDEVMVYLERNRDRVAQRLSSVNGVSSVPPEATYLYWLDLRATGLGDDPAAVLSEQANVTLLHGPNFGSAGRGHARLNFATTTSVLDEALDRLTGFLSEPGQDRSIGSTGERDPGDLRSASDELG